MITDDSGTPGPGGWEINTAVTSHRSHAGRDSELPLLDINYGVGERLQLKYETAWALTREAGGNTRSRWGESMLGVKWRFRDPGADGWRLSTYPQIELPHDDERSTLLLPVELDRKFDFFELTLDVGRERPADAAGSWFGGAVVGFEVDEELQLMAEAHAGDVGAGAGQGQALLFGMRWAVPAVGTLLLSFGREFGPCNAEPAMLLSYIGWQFASN